MAKAKRRRTKKRKPVNRGDRVEATPETIAKLRPCPLKAMLHIGTMQPDQYEAALQISAAFGFITRHVGYRPMDLGRIGIGHGEMGGSAERATAIYIAWGSETYRRLKVRPHVFVDLIDGLRPLGLSTGRLLVKACRLWIRSSSDYDHAKRAERGRIDSSLA